jgi:hypothetical protein
MASGPDPLSQNEVVDVGADAHIIKPFETQKLIDEVRNALGLPLEDSVAAIRFTPKSVKAQAEAEQEAPAPEPVQPEHEETFDDATLADEGAPAAMATETQVDLEAPPSLDLPPAIELGPPPSEEPSEISQTAIIPPEVIPAATTPEPIVFKGPPPPTIKRPPPPAPAKSAPVPDEDVASASDATSDMIVPPVAGDAPPPLEFSPPVEANEPPAVEPLPPAPDPEPAPMLEAEDIEEVAPPVAAAIPAPEAPTMMVRAISPEPRAAGTEETFRPEPTLSMPALISQVPDLGINFDLDSDDEDEGGTSPVDLNDLEALMPAIEAAVRKVTAEVVERVVWEVVPDLAERLIREKLAETDLDR